MRTYFIYIQKSCNKHVYVCSFQGVQSHVLFYWLCVCVCVYAFSYTQSITLVDNSYTESNKILKTPTHYLEMGKVRNLTEGHMLVEKH